MEVVSVSHSTNLAIQQSSIIMIYPSHNLAIQQSSNQAFPGIHLNVSTLTAGRWRQQLVVCGSLTVLLLHCPLCTVLLTVLTGLTVWPPYSSAPPGKVLADITASDQERAG